MKPEESPGNKGGKKSRFGKAFWISAAIAFLASCVLALIIAIIEYYSLGAGELNPLLYHLSEDGLGLSGLLTFFVFLLSYCASKGAFDFLAYSLKVLVYTVFRPHYRETGFPRTYYDYKVLKDSEERKPLLALLFVSLIFILAGFILMMISLSKTH